MIEVVRLGESDVGNEHLGDVLELCIGRQKSQAVLHGASRDPEIVGGDRPADRSEAVQDDRRPLGRFFIHRHHVDTRRRQKLLEGVPGFFGMRALLKPGLSFAQDNRSEGDRVRRLQSFFDFLIPAHARSIGGGIQEDSHYFERSWSIVRCLASARSNAAASAWVHEP